MWLCGKGEKGFGGSTVQWFSGNVEKGKSGEVCGVNSIDIPPWRRACPDLSVACK